MRTRLQLWNPRTIARLVKEGRGQGHGKTYLPWLTVRDVSTRGLACRVLGHVTGRTHHLLSWHLELAYFYVLDWSHPGDRRGRVTDIREQFPLLPLDETLRIAAALGIAHPADPRTGRPIVMTTDFLISVGTGRGRSELARSTKPADQLTLRFAEKFEIERRYWAARGVECLIVTEREIPRVITDNLAILHPFADFPRRAGLPAARINAIAAALTRRMALGDTSLAAVAGACDESFGLAPGTGLAVAHHLLATQQWNIDHDGALPPARPARGAPQRAAPGRHAGRDAARAGGMSATLLRNTLIEWLDGEPDPVVERILAIDPAYGTLWSIDIAAKRPWPVLREIDEVAGALAEGAARLLHADPLPAPRPPLAATATMPGRPARRTRVADDLTRRDRAWEAIRPLVEGPTDELFHESTRGPLITARARELGLDRGLLMEYLRRYWRGGQTPDALLPRYRGRVGLNTPSTAPKVGQAKLGRPSGVKVKTGAATGLNVTPAIRERLERGFARWTKGPGAKISKAYERTVATYFRRGFERGPDGELRPLLLPPDERPTVEQFRYHLERWRELRRTGPDGPERETIERVGRRHYNLLLRAIPGDSTRLAFGPGFQWQIDATIGDIYLVHSGDRSRLVGRPVIYLVIDVFSRLIVGFAVLLEGPSWTGARQALANAVADKVALCAQHGVTIEPGEWPVAGCMARAILADRGEFIGVAADTLTAALGTTVLNAAAFRPDWKGIVERQFRIINDETIAFVPGQVHRRERGERDCRLDAELDIHEFTTLLILGILKHNHSRLRGYNFDAYAIADHVEPYPIDLWDWGIRNRGGALGAVTIEAARRALLPRVTASVTARGIRAPKTDLHYTCARATREGWFSTAREKGVRRVTLAFDPRRTEYAYLDRGEGDLEPCTLLERAATFAGWSWQEAQDYTATRDTGATQARGRDEQRAANYQAAQDHVVDTGKRKTAAARGAAKPTLGETSAARAEENAGLRDHDGLTPADLGIATGSTAGPTPVATGDDDDYVPPVINLSAYRTTPDPDASGK